MRLNLTFSATNLIITFLTPNSTFDYTKRLVTNWWMNTIGVNNRTYIIDLVIK